MAPLGRRTTSCYSCRALILLLVVLELLIATQALGNSKTQGEDQPGIQSSNTNMIGNPALDGCRGDTQYQCASGTWICDVQRCDGVDDCEDGDDEGGCACGIGMFMCDFIRCMDMDSRCDMTQDCQDNTDEEGCVFYNVSTTTTTTTTTKPPLSCPSAEQGPNLCDDLVTQACFCDGKVECPTREDEALENCRDKVSTTTTTTTTKPPLSCPSAEQGPNLCDDLVTQACFCDGKVECPTREDEALENCRDKGCATDEFTCRDGACIPISEVCNGAYNCRDGSDEDGCPSQGCGSGEWQCKDSTCIPVSFLCDGFNDCPDNSDEDDDTCNTPAMCGSDEWTCRDGTCISLECRCDGRYNCPDHSDEHQCPGNWWWYCRNGQVIQKRHRCDGYCHCNDNSDERHCPPWLA